MVPRVIIFLSFLFFAFAQTENRISQIEGSLLEFKNQQSRFPGAKDVRVILTGRGREYSTLVNKDGSFSLEGVEGGSYMMQVSCNEWMYSAIRVDVGKTGQIRVSKRDDVHSLLPYPIRWNAERRMDYFTTREGFQVLSLLTNPMALMMGMTLVMTWVIPKMMDSLGEEGLKELQGNQTPLEAPPVWNPPPFHLSIKNK